MEPGSKCQKQRVKMIPTFGSTDQTCTSCGREPGCENCLVVGARPSSNAKVPICLCPPCIWWGPIVEVDNSSCPRNQHVSTASAWFASWRDWQFLPRTLVATAWCLQRSLEISHLRRIQWHHQKPTLHGASNAQQWRQARCSWSVGRHWSNPATAEPSPQTRPNHASWLKLLVFQHAQCMKHQVVGVFKKVWVFGDVVRTSNKMPEAENVNFLESPHLPVRSSCQI